MKFVSMIQVRENYAWTMVVCWKWGEVNGYWIHFEGNANRLLMCHMEYSIQLELSEHISFYPSQNTLKMKTVIFAEGTNINWDCP